MDICVQTCRLLNPGIDRTVGSVGKREKNESYQSEVLQDSLHKFLYIVCQ